MKISAVTQLADNLQIDLREISVHQHAEAVCAHVLQNINDFESETTRALHWHGSMVYTGIGAGQVEIEVERALAEGLSTREKLTRLCDRIDDVAKAAEKLNAELTHLLPHKTMHTPHDHLLSSWKGGIGTAVIQLNRTHSAFSGGCKVTANRIRSVLKRMDAIDAAAAQEELEKSGIHQQMGMAV